MQEHNIIRLLGTSITGLFESSIAAARESLNRHVNRPNADFTRNRRLPFERMIIFLMTMSCSAVPAFLTTFFANILDGDQRPPTESAFRQQRAKLKPSALKEILTRFTGLILPLIGAASESYLFYCVDGTALSFLTSKGPGGGAYRDQRNKCSSMHIVAVWELRSRLFLDALFQPLHQKDEYGGMIRLLRRITKRVNQIPVIIADRGFASLNTMACAIRDNISFVYRLKLSWLKSLGLPSCEFDREMEIMVARSRKAVGDFKGPVFYVTGKRRFDLLPPGSKDAVIMKVRFVHIRLKNGTYELLATVLPEDKFLTEKIVHLYNKRWGIEISFSLLKGALSLEFLHTRNPLFVEQEVWGKLLLYNFSQALILKVEAEQVEGSEATQSSDPNNTRTPQSKSKHARVPDRTVAIAAARALVMPGSRMTEEQALSTIRHCTHAVRPIRAKIPPRNKKKRRRVQPFCHRPA